ncbi:MAG: aldehyde dehydrogenase family protein [Acidobacteria bacterium]|jgi:1-pyrroline-5-carboxylate dehydrogenase|nr:aldehyde dehydrogenase family protein [Acidobacteriota bacterium]
MTFKLTYSTMFDPPEEMHTRFETALREVRKGFGATHTFHVDGRDVASARTWEKRSPVDQRVVLGHFALGDAADVDRAVVAAKKAFDGWRTTPTAERVRLMKRVAQLLEERVFTIGAVLALEVGKNRMEALGETQETADFFSGYAAEMERSQAFDHVLPDDPLPGFRSHNRSIMKPHGVWGVITPFNFPLALAGGPVAAALVTGNTVVFKGATDTPWAGLLLAECLRDAGLPAGVFNYVTGSGRVVGEALASHPDLAGLTFTGSHEVGMGLYRKMAAGPYPRPCITEMGGKNPCVVTARADLERAATGIVRSAYGLTGQKCSALSRVYVMEDVANALVAKVVEKTAAIRVGDPCVRENWMGPVINAAAAESYERYCMRLREQGGRILVGGTRLAEGDLAHGFFVAPTVAEAPPDHRLFGEEMFQPIVMVARVKDLREGMARANDTTLGLTAGCYGDDEDARYFLDHIEAGVTYVNRPQGATTGAWPGYQPFGGWKGSGSTGKAIGSVYYLPLYLREQSQTVVE